MYNNTETKRFGYPCDTDANTNMLYKRRTFPCRKWKFEDVELNFPRDMKGMLRNFFGDTYMQLPPVEDRVPHHDIAYLDLNSPCEIYDSKRKNKQK